MLSLRPAVARTLGKVRAIRPIHWSGFPTQTLAPASILHRSASIALPDEYDRITHAIEGCDLAEWIAEAKGGSQSQPATKRYYLGDCLIADGVIYYKGGHEVLRAGNAGLLARGECERYGQMQLASVSVTEQYFGHWLTDTTTMLVLAEQMGVEAVVPWTDAATVWSHRAGYEQLLQSPFRQPRLALVKELWAVDDRPRNAARAARLRQVRTRLRSIGSAGSPAGSRIAIYRGLSGVRRHLTNEDEVLDTLVSHHGFAVVDPSKLTPAEIVVSLADAEIVAGVEGSHLLHAVVAARDNATIFAIMPPNRFSPALKWYTDMIDMRFGFTVSDPHGEDMRLPIDRLHAAMRNVERHIR